MRRAGLTLIVLATALGACLDGSDDGSWETTMAGEDLRLEGRVIEVDPTPMFVDGDGEITIETEHYGRVLIRIPARERVCQARGLEVFSSVVRGDSIRVLGRATGARQITVCVEEAHFLDRMEEG
jgi:hypothetical protein